MWHIENAIDVPFLHLVDVTADAILATGASKILLLGTRFTMEDPFCRERMESHGVKVIGPDDADRALVNRVIYDELVLGHVNDSSRRAFQEIIAAGVEAGAEGVILGCTEIELLIGPSDAQVPVFASTTLHATAAVDRALAGRS